MAVVRYILCIFNDETETDDNIMEGSMPPGLFYTGDFIIGGAHR
ncbi:hypothetical protein J2W97_000964 [Paenibacillus jamilae]|nr:MULTISPECIES: hypothetical protein [Paenibacillus]AUS27221.1 hypothetical protein C1A50_3054 [Paenibacillus polymyxa]MDN4113417.1 hypothetical protein [Paenibacillus polymyxa]MDP9674981.1 hypothetical protein [Paenibacillus jamilae]WOZ36569.1 hypothetical protein RQP19_14385 [Paenibacillus polymyxa]